MRQRDNMAIEILHEDCSGCELCVEACPLGAIEMSDDTAVIDLKKCFDKYNERILNA